MAGRPKLPDNESKQVFSLRLSAIEKQAIETASTKSGKKAREWAREILLEAARRDVKL